MIFYVPVLHTREKCSSHFQTLPNDIADFRGRLDAKVSAFDEMWLEIAAKIEALDLPWKQTRIYQDGLPVCDHEVELVSRLAEGGCRNFLFLAVLLRQGAMVEGTEDWNLLLEECAILDQLITDKGISADEKPNQDYLLQSRKLLVRRDKFILDRIRSTLKPGESSLVFMGIAHYLDSLLEKDYNIVRINYAIPLQTIQNIYGILS